MVKLKSILLVVSITFINGFLTNAQTAIETAVDTITIPNADAIKSHLYLPTIGRDGETSFSWSSSNKTVVNTDYLPGYNDTIQTPPGFVTRPQADTLITLTVTATNGSSSAFKNIDITVLAAPSQNEYVGYIYAYFSSVAGKSEVQQVHFAISDDGLRWRDLNENRPVLVSNLGDEWVRDPYIIRSPEGDHFYLIATDLDIYASKYGGNWGLMATQGSTSLMIWESDDLVNWSEQRMVNVASPIGAGNAWAPESIYDEKTGEFLVYWSSLIKADNYAKHRNWVAKTRDFINFSNPEIFVEESYSVIDASILKEGDTYYRLIKNEDIKNVYLEKSNQLLDYSNESGLGKSYVHIENSELEGYTGGYEGPTMFKFNNQNKWCALVDEYTGSRRGYIPFLSDNIDQNNSLTLATNGTYLMPTGAKHGTVIPITQNEYDALIDKWGVEATLPTKNELPVANYTFNNWESGATIIDQSQNNHDATIYGNATVIDDIEKGKVLYLDGSNDAYMAFPQGLFDGMDSMTISMDIKPQSDAFHHFVLGIGQDNYKYAFLRIRPDELRFASTTESFSKEQEIATTGSFLNNWMNLKLVKAGNVTKLYINNELVDTNDFMRTTSDLGSNILAYLGKSFYTGDPYFKGCFDNVKVYNRSLSEDEIVTSLNKTVNTNKKQLATPITSLADDYLSLKIAPDCKYIHCSIMDLNGKVVSNNRSENPGNNLKIKTSQLNEGLYLLRAFDNTRATTFKFLVRHKAS